MASVLPIIDLTIANNIYKAPNDGALLYKYAPFRNLKVNDLTDLRLSASTAKINTNTVLDLSAEVSYDNSVNIIINDKTNAPKIVNSRFYLTGDNNFKVADRKGSVDTNIYNVDTFEAETNLIKTINSVVTLEFLGITDGGKMPVGNYTFYFKLADADGNESDIVSESGKVVCHIGAVNQPTSIRGGQKNEDSGKIVKFRISNLDLAYDYINVYYTRSTGDGDAEEELTYKIHDKYSIKTNSVEVVITGYEAYSSVDSSEVNTQYTSFDSAQSIANCQNITFVANTSKNYDLYKDLEKYSLFITPELVIHDDNNIGNLDHTYKEIAITDQSYEYYNTKNIYYRLGYWDQEIYRFGIVYLLNDYSLSPVFNIRGIKELTQSTQFTSYSLINKLDYGDDYILTASDKSNPENIKGVFKINSADAVIDGDKDIKPIGIKFNFTGGVISGNETNFDGLNSITKGFFIVRQKRIPTILTQGISIATSAKAHIPLLFGDAVDNDGVAYKDYFTESFLSIVKKPMTQPPWWTVKRSDIFPGYSNQPKLKRSIFGVGTSVTTKNDNALLCPEAVLKASMFNSIFNSSEFMLQKAKYSSTYGAKDTTNKQGKLFTFLPYTADLNVQPFVKVSLLTIEPNTSKISLKDSIFSTKAGLAETASDALDPFFGDLSDFSLDADALAISQSKKVRGIFNTYVGADVNLSPHTVYNIYQKDYNPDNWEFYFKINYDNKSPFMAVSDRISWDNITNSTPAIFRGDCYINTYTHRMLWNFIDPELPTNTKIADVWTWHKNYKVKKIALRSSETSVMEDAEEQLDITGDEGATQYYYKLLDAFSFNSDNLANNRIILPEGKDYKKWSELYGIHGTSKINRPDVNAVPLGHWVTFKVCSNINLAMRDIDFTNYTEEALFGAKRSFYPLQSIGTDIKVPESNVINLGVSKSLGSKYHFEVPDVPFLKSVFNTRINYSNLLQESTFKNGNRIFLANSYRDYTNEYGSIIKLVEWFGTLIAVMEHGVLMIPVNERALMANASGEDVYINTDNVLPKNPKVLSAVFGSTWPESIKASTRFIYGIDTVGKKIWRTNGTQFEIISDFKIQKFLNDNINISQIEASSINNDSYVKTHYNAFKQDMLFILNTPNNKWNLCWNELTDKWSTRYSWFPEFSENINNIFYTFANKESHVGKGNTLYKHGFAGTLDEQMEILPTKWYDEQHPFEFEFVVVGDQGIQKVFDNLKIISNSTSPESFYFQIVGEGFGWNEAKEVINTFTTANDFETYLTTYTTVKKIPYILHKPNFVGSVEDINNTDPAPNPLINRDCTITKNNKTKENLIDIYQRGINIKTDGRLRGNMQYSEDSWDIQIQPLTFKYAYINSNGDLAFSNNSEMKIRDKYIKIRIRYDGTKYAIITALRTLFTLSYA